MFTVGDRVIYGNHGVCNVERIAAVDLAGVPSDKQFYYLSPMMDASGIVYAPVENPKIVIRPIMTEDEAQDLIEDSDKAECLEVATEKQREVVYKECIRSCDAHEWVKLLKTIHTREKQRIEQGKKMTALDERYRKQAENQLFNELSIVLGITREDAAQKMAI